MESNMIVTYSDLKTIGACADHLTLFSKLFGEAVEVTRENLTRAMSVGMYVEWWGHKTFGAAFERSMAPAGRQYSISCRAAWIHYHKDREQWGMLREAARREYDRAMVEAILKLANGA